MPKYVLPKAFVNGEFVTAHVVEIPKGAEPPAGAVLLEPDPEKVWQEEVAAAEETKKAAEAEAARAEEERLAEERARTEDNLKVHDAPMAEELEGDADKSTETPGA
jgi:hypothetical protein